MGESGLSNKAKAARVAAGSGAVLSLGASLIATAGPAGAATFNVTSTADAGAGSLRAAIASANAAAGADTITFQAGLGDIVLTTGQIDVLEDLTITDPEGDVSISTNDAGRVFYLQAAGAVTLSGLDLSDNDILGNGGAVLSIFTDLTIVDSTFSGNQVAFDGAAISAEDGGTLTITDSTFTGNDAPRNGGAVNAEDIDSLVITGSTFTDNYSGADGGGVQADDVTSVTVTDTTFDGNFADSDGGGLSVYANGGTDTVTITGVTATDNGAADQGGGTVLQDIDNGAIVIADSTFTANEGRFGGGVTFSDFDNTAATIDGSVFDDNIAEQYVGEGSFGGPGGGLYLGGLNESTTIITTTTFDANEAQYGGGIAADDAGTVTISESTISNNVAALGGGIAAQDTVMTIVNTTVSGNTATDGSGGGIGIYGVDGTDISISHSTITGNTANYGGGIFLGGYGTATLDHNILDGNVANGFPVPNATEPTVDYEGSAIFAATGKRVVEQVEVQALDSVTLTNNLVNGSIAGEVIDAGGNLFELPANLGPLADNGGPTLTHNLLTGSAALDAGDAAFAGDPTTDQRGLPRVSNARIDIGAVEVQVQEPVEPPVPPAEPVPAEPTFTG